MYLTLHFLVIYVLLHVLIKLFSLEFIAEFYIQLKLHKILQILLRKSIKSLIQLAEYRFSDLVSHYLVIFQRYFEL